MKRRKRKKSGARSVRRKRDQEEALFHVIYEMLILASALLLCDKRYFLSEYPNLQWGPAKIADDVIRLKSRLFRDFLLPSSPDPRDMVVWDFNVPFPPLTSPPESQDFRDRIENTGTAHLSWGRIKQTTPTATDRKTMETHALWLLDRACDFLDACRRGGFALDKSTGELLSNFQRVHNYLHSTPRVDESTGPRPRRGMVVAVPISLESLLAVT